MSLDNRHAIGRTDSAFYAEKLPAVLRPYVKDLNQATISSSKLLLNLFSSEFHKNLGWANAKILYANFIFQEKNKPQIVIGEDNFAVKNAERARLKGFAEVVSKAIFGHPATIKNSPLPKILIDDLIYADQYFYEKLLTHPVTQNWSIEQMQDARYALQKLLSVTRLLMPMFTVLADKKPSQQEIWCLGLILQTLLNSASELSKEILVTSFSDADPSLQKRVQEKEKLERIQNRTKTFKTKTLPRHTRSRSADTTPIDLKSLMSPQAARKKRALEKTGQVVADLLFADDSFDKVLDEGMKAIEENDEIRRVQAYIKDLSLDDLAEIEQMLADRDEQELIGLIPDGELKPERAQPLPESTADLSTPIFSEDNDPFAELAESTLSEPIQADDSSKALGKEKNNEVFEKNEVNRESDANQENEFHQNTELTKKNQLGSANDQ